MQNQAKAELPSSHDIDTIETTDNAFRFYTPASLRRILPQLVPTEHGSVKPPGYQYGTITLKDGTKVRWKSSHFGNVTIYDDVHEQFYLEQESFLDRSLGPLTYFVVSLVAFALFLFVFMDKRIRLTEGSTQLDELIKKDYWKIMLQRILAFAFFVLLAYLILKTPLQRINDGAFLDTPGRFSSHSEMVFADANPSTFWLHVVGGIIVGLLPLLIGTFFLIFNPRSLFWARKPKAV